MFEQVLARPLFLIFPVMFGGIIHMLVVRYDWLRSLKVPVSQVAFGKNKTWRGFFIMPLSVMLGWAVMRLLNAHVLPITWTPDIMAQWWKVGPLVGLFYVVGELPNSFLKRRLGIREGALPEKGRWFFFLMDHLDSTITCVLIYMIFFGIDKMTALFCIAWSVIIHTSVNYALYLAGIRKNPF